jgi:hypothetical protein
MAGATDISKSRASAQKVRLTILSVFILAKASYVSNNDPAVKRQGNNKEYMHKVITKTFISVSLSKTPQYLSFSPYF